MACGGGITSPSSMASRPESPEGNYLQQSQPAIVSWGPDKIEQWLKEQNLEKFTSSFREQQIHSGAILLQMTEDHFKEMGVTTIGERLSLVTAIDKLRMETGLSPSAKFFDSNHLLKVIEEARDRRCQKVYPKRIILIRHAESEGNVNRKIYATTPDPLLKITELGHTQAKTAGLKLRELIGNETVSFYVSPFVRSKETFEVIKEHFDAKQITQWREDPRIREQEWGNFQNPDKMYQVMDERRHIGSFFYRFPTGESGADVYDRVSIFLESLYRDMYKERCGQNVMIVSHGLFCRLFLTRFYRWPIEFFHRLWNFQNCQYAIMEFQEGGYYKLVTELLADDPLPKKHSNQ